MKGLELLSKADDLSPTHKQTKQLQGIPFL